MNIRDALDHVLFSDGDSAELKVCLRGIPQLFYDFKKSGSLRMANSL